MRQASYRAYVTEKNIKSDMPIFLATRKDTGCMVAVKTMLEFCFKIATLLLTLFYAAVRSIYQYRYNQKHKKRRVHFFLRNDDHWRIATIHVAGVDAE